MISLFFLILGVFSLSAQTLLLREYLVIFEGNELGIGFFFSSWFLWIAVGAYLTLSFQKLSAFLFPFLPYLLFLYSLALPVQIYFCKVLRLLSGVPAYEVIPPVTLIALTMVLNLPLSFLTGIIFSLGCRFFDTQKSGGSQSVTRAYVFESLGSFVSGIAVTYFLAKGGNSLFAALISLSALSLASLFLSKKMERRGVFFLHLLVFVSVVLVIFSSSYDDIGRYLSEMRLTIISPQAELIAEIETPYQVVTAARIGTQTVIFSHGQMIASFPSWPDRRDLAALIMAQNSGMKKVLVIGAGGISLVERFLDYDIEEVTLIEQDTKLFHFIRVHSTPQSEFLKDSRMQVIHDDPVLFLNKTKGTYDAVVLLSSEPKTLVSNRFFVREFYEIVNKSLNQKGLFLTEVSSAENYIGTELALYGRSVYATLKEVFQKVLITPGESSLFIASPSESITLDPSILIKRYDNIQNNRSNFPSEAFFTMLPPERVAFTRKVYESNDRVDLVNTQERPKTFFFNLLVMFKQSDSRVVKILKGLAYSPLFVLFIPLLVIFILLSHFQIFTSRERLSSLASILLTIAGGAAISTQILLLTSFQARFGTLFVQLGLANALFMVGLVLGAQAGQWVMGGAGIRAMFFILSCASIFSFSIPFFTRYLDYYLFHLLFLVSGCISGALWPSGGTLLELSGKESGTIASYLESSDHWGAFIGSALCSIIILPISGVQGTSLMLTLLFGLSIPLVLLTLFLQKKHDHLFLRKLVSSPLKRPSLPLQRLFYVLFFMGLITVLYGHIVYNKISNPKVTFKEEELLRYVKSDRYEERQTPFIYYLTFLKKKDQDFDKVIVSSMSVVPTIRGFSGPVNLLIALDNKGIISNVSLIESRETPTYIKGIDRFLKQFEGKVIGWDFSFADNAHNGIDAMSGATVTSEAVRKIINETKAVISEKILGIDVQRSKGESFVSRLMRFEVIYMFLALIFAVYLYHYGSLRMRTAFLILNLFLAGIIFNLQLSITQLLLIMRFELPPLYDTAHFLLVWGALILAILFGPLYCSYLCPFGAFQEIVSTFGKPLNPTPYYAWYMRSLKYIVLALVVLCAFHARWERILSFDPLQHAFSFTFGLLTTLILGVILFACLYYFRFYCRYLCPVGAFLCLFNKIANRLPMRGERNYKNCDLGVHSPWDIDCIQCNRCTRRQK